MQTILVKAYAGSHLFGTNTPESDTDFKGVYIPSEREVILQKVQHVIQDKREKALGEKNTKDDIDVEYISLHKFLNMVYEGQTAALELLFTPDHLIVEQHPIWKFLKVHCKQHLMNKKVSAFVDYCKTQADKYGVKGSRMAAVKDALTLLTKIRTTCGEIKLKDCWTNIQLELKEKQHIEFGVQDTQHGQIPYMQICERKFQDNQKITYTINSLQNIYDVYGERARKAESNEGIDWKALSHAYRVCCQAIELLTDHKITLPLKKEDLKIVRDTKLGLIPYPKFRVMLEEKLEQVLLAKEVSFLPEDVPVQLVDALIITYCKHAWDENKKDEDFSCNINFFNKQ